LAKPDLENIKSWIKLLEAPDIGNAKAVKLAKTLGQPKDFFDSNKLDDIEFISQKAKASLREHNDPKDWNKIAELIEKFEIGFVSVIDDGYPAMLKSVYDPPPFLFYRGNYDNDLFRRTIAVVGTRKASNYGQISAKRISAKLSQNGFTIVSGLAYGIDTLSHLAAMENSGKTIAVMGTGVDTIYPPRNRELAEKILENGLLISEFIPGRKAEKWNFPTRNRIISGLSLGSFIVEGSKKSGALLTAKFALDQNRDIFALPGDINREQSAGPNYLIKLGAKIVCSVDDILEEYDLILTDSKKSFPKLNPDEEKLYRILIENKPEILFDSLLIKTGMSVGELSTILLTLELKSIIKKMPGNKIVPVY
jgi:DNA processing protein